MTRLTNLLSLDGKVAVVTGAASGLGAHFAEVLAYAGAHVVCLARRQDRIQAVADKITAKGGSAVAIQADVTDRASLDAAFDATSKKFGVVDILVNNAGVTSPGPLQDITEAQWAFVVDTNLTGVWRVAQMAAQRMAGAGKGGTIINIASILSFIAKADYGSYAAAKGGVLQLTRSLALDFLPINVRVNAIAPGYFNTEISEEWNKTEQGMREIAGLPNGRLGRYEELDGPLLLLASDASSYMNGSAITVDYGHSIRLS